MSEPQSLALKYRPTKFDDMIGQRLNAVVLQGLVDKAVVPQGFLFSGPSGTGKTTAARILASELNAGELADVIEIDAASNGGVADIRSLIETLRYGHQGKYRVVILDEAHMLTREGFNALLKTLEEPPTGTVFVLVTTEPEKVPKTVLSRLMEFSFQRITPGEIHDRLAFIAAQEKIEVTPALLVELAQRAEGSARVGIMALDQMSFAQISTVEQHSELTGEHDTAPALVASLLTGDSARIFSTLDEQLARVGNALTISVQMTQVFRDLLVLRSGGQLARTGPYLEARRELAQRLENERIFAAARILWDLKTRVRVSNDARENLELALILISEVFSRGKAPISELPVTPPTPAPPQSVDSPKRPQKLSLADLQRLR